MRVLLAVGILLVAASATAAAQECWSNLGVKQEYDPPAQLQELRQLVQQHDCPVLAMMWRLRMTEERRSVLVWDAEAETVWRIRAGDDGAQWEAWPGSTRDQVLSDTYLGVISRGPAHGFGSPHAGRRQGAR